MQDSPAAPAVQLQNPVDGMKQEGDQEDEINFLQVPCLSQGDKARAPGK